MHRLSLRVVVIAVLALAIAGARGGGLGAKAATTSPSATASALPFKATFSAPSHHPVVNKNWPITVTATDLSAKPIAATLQLNVLLGILQVGQVDNGKVHHFVGHYRENVTWPRASVGHKLTLQAVVKAKGKTKKLSWTISVVNK